MADSDPSTTLTGIRERAHELTIDLSQEDHCGATPCTGHDALRLLAAVEAVLKEHRPIDRGRVLRCCAGCEAFNDGFHEDCCHEWPCPTYETITTALTGKEADQ